MVITIMVGTVTNSLTLPDVALVNDPEVFLEAGDKLLRTTVLQASQAVSDTANQVPEQ